MEWKKIVALFFAAFLLMLPTHAFAVDFEITQVAIDAQLNADGTVSVSETHTYEFDGDFNGLTREIAPKQGTKIQSFTAFENGSQLKVEREQNVYKIFRSGDDETVTVEMNYFIIDAVEKFEDGAEFYWPFFDDRNESDYGNMTITILPPAPAEDPLFVGYGEAANTGSLEPNGGVIFDLGNVPSGENGDVRVVYDPELFPSLEEQPGAIRAELVGEQENQAEEAAAFAANKDLWNKTGSAAIPVLSGLFAMLFGSVWFASRKKKRNARTFATDFFVPKEKMSMPATIFFAKPSVFVPYVAAAALMDAVRKGYVRQLSDSQFERILQSSGHPHEAVFLDFLFNSVGDGKVFNTQDLEAFTKNESNAEAYQEAMSSWNKEISAEIKEHKLYSRHPGIRWGAAFISLLSAGLAIYFGLYGLYAWLAFSVFLALLFFGFACFYKPLTLQGHEIRAEWQHLRDAMNNLPEETWNRLSKDDKIRAYTFALGTEPASGSKETRPFALAEKFSARNDSSDIAFNPVFLAAVFITADSNSSAHAASSSSSTSFGGGVGGGGGGSGAF
ncbi:DUF2207 domain-containing protein [Planococcus sp. YIM B11945]|uniref:DUF2207 domain-containing protein n=1 Tax=Planococcus sp. YIM B11945 TaxID=3435410 RepID=UPI003D7F12BC